MKHLSYSRLAAQIVTQVMLEAGRWSPGTRCQVPWAIGQGMGRWDTWSSSQCLLSKLEVPSSSAMKHRAHKCFSVRVAVCRSRLKTAPNWKCINEVSTTQGITKIIRIKVSHTWLRQHRQNNLAQIEDDHIRTRRHKVPQQQTVFLSGAALSSGYLCEDLTLVERDLLEAASSSSVSSACVSSISVSSSLRWVSNSINFSSVSLCSLATRCFASFSLSNLAWLTRRFRRLLGKCGPVETTF